MSGLGLTFLRRGNLAHPTAGSDNVKFVDAEAFRVLMANGVSSDGVNITRDDMARVTSIAQWFRNNTTITDFPELALTNVTTLDSYAFQNCTALSSVDLSKITKTGIYAFQNCTSLQLPDISNIVTYGAWTFSGCTALTGDIVLTNVVGAMPDRVFHKTGILSFEAPYVTAIGANFFQNSPSLKKVILGEGMTSIGSSAFSACVELTALIVLATTPPTLDNSAFDYANKYSVYVPDASVDAYKAATRWSSIASKIKPLSQYNG